jgi:GLPGLI family protein
MKVKILLFALIFTLFISAQNTVKCTYKVINNNTLSSINEDSDTKKKVIALFQKVLNKADKLKYELLINKNESIFKKVDGIYNDINERDLKLLETIVSKGVYYQNIKDKISLHQNNIFGETFIIKDSISFNWKITDEFRTINDLPCYKAISKCVSCDNSNIIEVWFSPKINLPFGPKNYCNLPGLIIEVKLKLVTLRLDEINFNQNVIIEKPTKGKIITFEEYKKIANEMRSNAR